MKWLLILTFLYATPTFAQHDHESCDQEHGLLSSELDQLLKWFGADEDQIKKSPCKTTKVPSADEMKKFIADKSGSNKSDRNIHDVQFKNESPALLNAFEDLTSMMDQVGFFYQSEEQVKIQNTYGINPECEQVLCAAKKIWGENGLKMLYIKLKHGYNTSELAFKDSDRFTDKELDDVILGLEDLPAHLTPLAKGNQRLTPFKRGYTLASYGNGNSVVANAVIMLFDAWSEDSSIKRQYTIFHETGHNIGTHLNKLDESQEWNDLSGWIKKGDEWSSSPEKGCFVSKYGTTNPAEDFAESISTYRYNGKDFKEQCPKKYAFLKDHVFKEIEYTAPEQCLPPTPEKMAKVKGKVSALLTKGLAPTEYRQNEVVANCKNSFSAYPVSQEEISRCSLGLQLQGPLKSELSQILKAEGIAETQINIDLVLKSISDDLKQNSSLSETLYKNSKGLLNSIEKIVEDSLPKSIDDKSLEKGMNFLWYDATKVCGIKFFSTTVEERQKCQIQEAIRGDRNIHGTREGVFPLHEAPSIFSASAKKDFQLKHEEKIIQLMMKKENMKSYFAEQDKKFIADFDGHRTSAAREVRKLPRWSEMSPAEFCEKTYGKASVWLFNYGYESGALVSELINKCASAQSKQKKRFEFTKSQWDELIK